MATGTAKTTPLAEAGRRGSSSSQRALSHGRGGAGNIGTAAADQIDPADLSTPTIKSDVYTTGRGGSGNMAHNTDPKLARMAQDVETSHPRPDSTSHDVHVGRGGAANVFKPTPEEIAKAKAENQKYESAIVEEHSSHHKGLADKGKEWLFGNKSKATA